MPPWLLKLLQQYDPAQQQQPSPNAAAVASPASPVSGGDMADIFASAIGQMNTADQARNELKSGLLFGRHLDMGGFPIKPNPSGSSGNAYATATWQGPEERLAEMTNKTGAYAPSDPGLAARERVINAMPQLGGHAQPDVAENYAPPTGPQQAAFNARPFIWNGQQIPFTPRPKPFQAPRSF